jgi:hypothetical protein
VTRETKFGEAQTAREIPITACGRDRPGRNDWILFYRINGGSEVDRGTIAFARMLRRFIEHRTRAAGQYLHDFRPESMAR